MSDKTLDRRRLLTGGLLGAGAAALAAVPASAATAPLKAGGPPKFSAPALIKGLPDVVVVGAGAFGGWTALELRERGYKVTMVDAYGPGNPHASSGGETRNIRSGYGDRGIYSEWASRAWIAWHRRQEEFGRKLIYPSSSLRDPGAKEMGAQIKVFDQLKLPYEMLTPDEVHKRWPQISFADSDHKIFFDTNSGGVKARESMIAVSEVFEHKGGTIKLGYAELGGGAKGKLNDIVIDGERLPAGQFVFAGGPWLPMLFPNLMKGWIRTPRSELFFVAPARGDNRYHWENAPSISDTITYTTADIGGGYKIAARMGGVTMDPDDGERLATYSLIPQVEAYVKLRLPGLVGRPILSSYVCQTENSNTGHYIMDSHPDYANALIAGGGSGHAFKMGPILGPYIADLVAGKPMPAEHKALFSLAAHSPWGSAAGGAAAMPA